MSFLVPLRLLGEGSYALSSVKQISVTEDYLKLSDDTRKCQNIESFEQCVTKHNLATISKACKCIPYWLRNFTNEEVHKLFCKRILDCWLRQELKESQAPFFCPSGP